jgi:ferredoxin
MKVQVDVGKCQGHTSCAMLAPDSFELSDVDGHARAIVEPVERAREAEVLEASQSCPEQAIVVALD